MGHKAKKITIRVRVDEDEWQLINERAKKADLDVSKYLRKMAFKGVIYKQDLKSIHSLIYEVNRIGNNLNQITRLINRIGGVNKSDIDYINKQVEAIWRLLNLKLLKPTYQKH